jgi:High potential iron-sulfur protein
MKCIVPEDGIYLVDGKITPLNRGAAIEIEGEMFYMAPKASSKPPHLRESDSMTRCGMCAWYHHDALTMYTGRCAMFAGYHVVTDEFCDSYERGKPGTKG